MGWTEYGWYLAKGLGGPTDKVEGMRLLVKARSMGDQRAAQRIRELEAEELLASKQLASEPTELRSEVLSEVASEHPSKLPSHLASELASQLAVTSELTVTGTGLRPPVTGPYRLVTGLIRCIGTSFVIRRVGSFPPLS